VGRAQKYRAFNHVFINWPLGILAYYITIARGVQIDAPLPSLLEILGHLVVFVISQEIGFYYSHRYEMPA